MTEVMLTRQSRCIRCAAIHDRLPTESVRNLHSWAAGLHGEATPDAVLLQATVGVAALSGAARASVVVPLARSALRVFASSDLETVGDLIVSLDRYPELEHVLRHGEPILIEHVRQSPLLEKVLPLLHKAGVQSIVAVPLDLGGVDAILHITSDSRAFGEGTFELLQAVAHTIEHRLARADQDEEDTPWKLLATEVAEGVIDVAADGRIMAASGRLFQARAYESPRSDGPFIEDIFAIPESEGSGDLVIALLDGSCPSAGLLLGMTLPSGAPITVRAWSVAAGGFAPRARIAVCSSSGDGITEERLRASLRRQVEEIEGLREQLGEIETTRTQFLSASAHELKTPLTVIQSYLETLVTDLSPGLSAEQHSFLRIAYDSVLRLRRLVVDLVDLAALNSGNIRLDIGRVRLEPLISEVIQEMTPLALRAGVTIERAALAGLEVRADPLRFQQVFRNLLDNAIKFTTTGGTVTVRGATLDHSVVVTVEDTGVGIPADQLAAVCDAFMQAAPPPDRLRRGAGLGLTISSRLIRALGGRIEIESTEGVGSTFSVRLPRWPEEE